MLRRVSRGGEIQSEGEEQAPFRSFRFISHVSNSGLCPEKLGELVKVFKK